MLRDGERMLRQEASRRKNVARRGSVAEMSRPEVRGGIKMLNGGPIGGTGGVPFRALLQNRGALEVRF
ncbi:hypothetical protein [Rhizobium phage RHph_X2_26]|nr:hypothetical protein [Rhizobium phage RHph_X2_26]